MLQLEYESPALCRGGFPLLRLSVSLAENAAALVFGLDPQGTELLQLLQR